MRNKKFVTIALILFALLCPEIAFARGSVRIGKRADGIPVVSEKRSDELAEEIDESFIDANIRFAFSIFQELVSEDKGQNIFISSFSILLAMAMTYNGAASGTYLAIREALQFAGQHRLGFVIEEDFIDVNEKFYSSEVKELDFSGPGAVDKINRWIADATKGEIEEMLSGIPGDVVMYLINAIYFKGDWTYPFSEDATQDRTFTWYFRGSSYGVLRLPYGQEKLSMYILLPDEGEDLDEIIQQADEHAWKELESAAPRERVEFIVDRPFFFVIADDRTRCILFMGKVVEP